MSGLFLNKWRVYKTGLYYRLNTFHVVLLGPRSRFDSANAAETISYLYFDRDNTTIKYKIKTFFEYLWDFGMWAGDETPSDEMFVDGEDSYLNSNRESDGTSNSMLQDLLHNNKLVHQDFFNDFPQDLFDDDDLTWWWT